MSELKSYVVEHTSFSKEIRTFLMKWHYSDYVNIQYKHTFQLLRPGQFGIPEVVGVCIYTRPAGPTAGLKYWPQAPEKVLELRRLCLVDATPKNAESYFVSRTLKWLKKNTEWQFVISYADQNQGHAGTIYKAANFNYLGETNASKTLEVDGKLMHIRTLSMMDRPYGVEINKRWKEKDPNIKIIETLPKHIFTYKL